MYLQNYEKWNLPNPEKRSPDKYETLLIFKDLHDLWKHFRFPCFLHSVSH